MSDTTNIKEGETVMIGTNHYRRVGNKLVNLNDSNDVVSINNGGSLVDVMLEKLNVMNG